MLQSYDFGLIINLAEDNHTYWIIKFFSRYGALIPFNSCLKLFQFTITKPDSQIENYLIFCDYLMNWYTVVVKFKG